MAILSEILLFKVDYKCWNCVYMWRVEPFDVSFKCLRHWNVRSQSLSSSTMVIISRAWLPYGTSASKGTAPCPKCKLRTHVHSNMLNLQL